MSTSLIIFITGPTAVGKSDVALNVARKLDGEIIACDSMQVYREINVASNKPSPEERKQTSYHMLDVASVYDEFDVNQYAKLAIACVKDIISRGKQPIVCGGTGLYMEALIDGVFEGPKADWNLREKLEQESPEQLHARLEGIDPDAAAKIHPNDLRRIIRALEVFELTGKPISVWQKDRTGLADKYAIKGFVLTRGRDALYATINTRVDQMINQGLIDEVSALDLAHISKTARQLIGIKETLQYLNNEIDRDRLIEIIKQNSRHYAKRQLTWFRKDERLQWIDLGLSDPLKEILDKRF